MEFNPWNSMLAGLPAPHILQTTQWGQVKSTFGWKPSWIIWQGERCSITHRVLDDVQLVDDVLGLAQVLIRSISFRGRVSKLNVVYVPKGPILRNWEDEDLRLRVLADLENFARQTHAIFIKIDPDIRLGLGAEEYSEAHSDPLGRSVVSDLSTQGWQFSADQIQFRNTLVVDLSPSEDQILARMKQKTRYNVNLAVRKGVTIRDGTLTDLEMLYRMYAETANRDGFVIRSAEYYRLVWESFMQAGMAIPLIAEVEGAPVAAVFIFFFEKKAWYLYGMSREMHREKMPNYLLQWEAMRCAKASGCLEYDLWGAPEKFDETDPLWGVFRFKEGLGGQIERHIGAWDLPIRPLYYRLYTQILPLMMGIIRRRRMAANQSLGRGL